MVILGIILIMLINPPPDSLFSFQQKESGKENSQLAMGLPFIGILTYQASVGPGAERNPTIQP